MAVLALLVSAALDTAAGSAALRSEARARTAYAGEAGAVEELQLDANLSGWALGPALRLLGAYEPRLRAARGQGVVELMSQARAMAEWTAAPGRTLRLEQRAAFGKMDYSPLNPAAAAPDRPPSSRVAQTLRSSTQASWDETPARGVRLGATASFEVSGGAGAEARAIVPLQRGPRATALASWDVTPVDVLGASLSASATRYSNGAEAYLGGAEASLRHQFSPALSVEAAAGAGAAGDAARARALPIAGLRARLEVPARRLDLDASARAAPASDWLGAGVYERGEASLGARYEATPVLAINLRAGASTALSGLSNQGIAQGQLGISWRLARGLTAEAGMRSAWTPQPIAGQPQWQWMGLVAFSAATAEVLPP